MKETIKGIECYFDRANMPYFARRGYANWWPGGLTSVGLPSKAIGV